MFDIGESSLEGCNVRVSECVGEKENEEASHQIESALFSTLLLPYLLLLLLLLLASPSSPSAERARRERRLARRIRKK